MGCGCGGKKFTGSGVTGMRSSSGQPLTQAAPTPTVVRATGVQLGTAPVIQPMQRKTV